jgi:glycosyltransferase involved in cell wall biosynthesis
MSYPGLAEVVVDGVTGMLVPPGDVAALSRSMENMLASTEVATTLGKAARARMEANWSIQATVDAYESVYRDALRHQANGAVGRSV